MFPFGNPFLSSFSMARTMAVVTGVCLFLAVIAGFLLYFWFLSKKNQKKFTGFWGWMYEFLNFEKMLAESILRVTYLIFASHITLLSFGYLLFTEGGSIGERLLTFLSILVFGNAAIRVLYEFLLITLIICRNTTEINNKMGGKSTFADAAAPTAPTIASKTVPATPAATPPVVHIAPLVAQVVPPATPAAAPPIAPIAPPDSPVPQIVFCYSCGKKISSNDAKCPHCGADQQ